MAKPDDKITLPEKTWKITVTHIKNDVLRSTAFVIRADNIETAKDLALASAETQGYDEPRITKAVQY